MEKKTEYAFCEFCLSYVPVEFIEQCAYCLRFACLDCMTEKGFSDEVVYICPSCKRVLDGGDL